MELTSKWLPCTLCHQVPILLIILFTKCDNSSLYNLFYAQACAQRSSRSLKSYSKSNLRLISNFAALGVHHIFLRSSENKTQLWFFCFVATDLCSPSHTFFPSGLSPAGTLWGDSDPSRGGEAHHPEGQESAPASVWPARLWVCPPHPGCQPQSHSSSLQQLQRAVPEQLGRSGDTWPHSARLGVVDAWPAKKKYSTDIYWIFFFQKMVVWDII